MAIVPIEPRATAPQPGLPASAELREDPRIRLAQLARLHDEAAETAVLANLLGRAPQIVAALSLSALAVAGLSFGAQANVELMVWLALVAGGIAALLRSYARTMAAPFEIFALKAFSGDLSAILFYAGFAWGAGAFLALPAGTSLAAVTLFAAVPCALVAALSRTREASLMFAGPVAGLGAIAALVRPLGGIAGSASVLAACAVVAGVSYWMEKLSAREPMARLLPAG
ncbi:MAG: hypothetical protein ACREHE_04390 [Rhizomicrobium sp.]